MNYKQILDKLAADRLVEAIEDDVALLLIYFSEKNIDFLFNRWNCVLLAEDGVSELYKQKTYLAFALVLHKNGIKNEEITQKALLAIDKLNEAVALSDAFYRQSPEIKKFLQTEAKPRKKRPAFPQEITFFRAKDVISIQFKGKYYAAYIHELTGVNESPVIEFYDAVFDKVPTIEELKGLKAKGRGYNDGSFCIVKFSVYGMKFLPDLANQVHLIDANNSEVVPCEKHLEESVGLYEVRNILSIQTRIEEMFGE